MPHIIHSRPETKRQSAPVTSKVSSCGCSSHEETCCQLDCLTQPHFFGGQLLADTDLTQLLTWSKDKFRLSRYRHGWGVVCGLDVQCDSGSPAVRVTPGYAMDCCGHDILVCEDASISLDEACSSLPDPCASPEKSTTASGGGEEAMINLFGCWIPKSEVHEKILTIRYAEIPADFQTALGYATPDGTANCQPSRMREGFSLGWTDPLVQTVESAESWNHEYDACREVVKKYRDWHEGWQSDGSKTTFEERREEIRNWLLKWIDGRSGFDAHPLHQFCWLSDCLCTMEVKNQESLDQHVINILFWLVQDCRNHFLQTTCRDCPDDHGVPLARVCLWVPKRQQCRVLAIDPYPPYRRPLSQDSWPTPSGLVNIGKAIWQPPEQARALLTGMGLTVAAETPFQLGPDLYTLHDDLASNLFVGRDQRISLQVFDTQGPLGWRVVGVRSVPGTSDSTGRAPSARRKGGE